MSDVFVFGSNLAGRHGKRAALHALKHCGAVYGKANGRQGNSYAIPTKDEQLKPLPLPWIRDYVRLFLLYAWNHPDDKFLLTQIGCGLAGYSPEDIAPFFADAPENVIIPKEWDAFITS